MCDPDVFEDLAGIGIKVSLGDDEGQEVNIGFNFTFFDAVHETTTISSNGYITFGMDASAYIVEDLVSADVPNNFIAPLFVDLHPGRGGTINYRSLLETDGMHTFIAQWTNVPDLTQSDDCDDCISNTFQVVLYEADGCFEFRYRQCTALDIATIGFENANGTDGFKFENVTEDSCIKVCPPIPSSPPSMMPSDSPSSVPSMSPSSTCDVCVETFYQCYQACK